MGKGYLIGGLVLAFVLLDVLVVLYLFRRARRRAAALRVPSQRIPSGRPRRGAFDVDNALTWSANGDAAFSTDDSGLTWDDDLDGYTDLSGSHAVDLVAEPPAEEPAAQSRPSAASNAE